MGQRRNPIKKSYRITIGEPEYRDVISLMDSLPKTSRGLFVAEAVRFYCKAIREPEERGLMGLSGSFPGAIITPEVKTSLDNE